MDETETGESKSIDGFPLCFGHNTKNESGSEACTGCKQLKQCTVATLMKHKYKDVEWYTHLT